MYAAILRVLVQWIEISVFAVAVVEVERLWHRFQILGCDEDGTLPPEALLRPPASEDILVKNVAHYALLC